MQHLRVCGNRLTHCFRPDRPGRYLVVDSDATVYEVDTTSNRSAVLFSVPALLAERVEGLSGRRFDFLSLGCAVGPSQSRSTVFCAADISARLPFHQVLLAVDLDTRATVSVVTSSKLPPFDGYPVWLADDFIAYSSGHKLVCVQVSSEAPVSTAGVHAPVKDVDTVIPDVLSFDPSSALVACGFGEYYRYAIRVFRYQLSGGGLTLEFLHQHTSPSFAGDLTAVGVSVGGDSVFGAVGYFPEKRERLWRERHQPLTAPAGEIIRMVGTAGEPEVLSIPDSRPFGAVNPAEVRGVARESLVGASEDLRLAPLAPTRAAVTSLDGKLYLADFAAGTVVLLDTQLTTAVSCLRYFQGEGLLVGSAGGELCLISDAELGFAS
jgi:hypothetical protein